MVTTGDLSASPLQGLAQGTPWERTEGSLGGGGGLRWREGASKGMSFGEWMNRKAGRL